MRDVQNYYDDGVLKQEEIDLFNKFYNFGCHKNDILINKSYTIVEAFNKEIVLYNDNGIFIAFDNICPHRGASFFCDDKRDGCSNIKCPYHGWSYSDGKLNIVKKNSFKHEDIKDIDLVKYSVEFCGDFLFFSKSPILTLKSQLNSFYELLEKISHSIDKREDLNTTPFYSNWKIALENALENYHVPSVHKNTLAPMDLSNGEINFDTHNSIWISDIENKKLFKKLTKMKKLFPDVYQQDNYFSIYVFPFSMISSTFGLSYAFQSFYPKKVNEVSFFSRTYGVKSSTDASSFYQSVVNLNRTIFNEDIEVCNSIQNSSQNSDINFVYSSLESRILNFQNSYEKYVGRNND